MTAFSPAVEQLNVYLFQLINAPAAVSAGMLRVGTFFASDAVALFPLVLLFNWFWRGEEQKKSRALRHAQHVIGAGDQYRFGYDLATPAAVHDPPRAAFPVSRVQ